MAPRSLHWRLITEALAQRGTDLETFMRVGRTRGKSVADLHEELIETTGIPIGSRTLYRWIEDLEDVAS